jgi:hypothetical protein
MSANIADTAVLLIDMRDLQKDFQAAASRRKGIESLTQRKLPRHQWLYLDQATIEQA